MGRQRAPRRALLDQIDANGDCWKWTGYVDRSGYARFGSASAHRAVWERLVGPIPPGMQVHHMCENTVCVNPDHLAVVTPRENTRASGYNVRPFCRSGRHRMAGTNVRIRPNGTHLCRACKNDNQNRYRKEVGR